MTAHDPLCPWWPNANGYQGGCQCALIARVAEREREQRRDMLCAFTEVTEDREARARAAVAEEIAQAIEALLPSTHDLYNQGVRDAVVVARTFKDSAR